MRLQGTNGLRIKGSKVDLAPSLCYDVGCVDGPKCSRQRRWVDFGELMKNEEQNT